MLIIFYLGSNTHDNNGNGNDGQAGDDGEGKGGKVNLKLTTKTWTSSPGSFKFLTNLICLQKRTKSEFGGISFSTKSKLVGH